MPDHADAADPPFILDPVFGVILAHDVPSDDAVRAFYVEALTRYDIRDVSSGLMWAVDALSNNGTTADDARERARSIQARGAEMGFTILTGLAARARQDTSCAFEHLVVEALATLRREDAAAYERMRADLKAAGVRVGELDRAVSRAQARTRAQAQRGPQGNDEGRADWQGLCHANRYGEMLGSLHNAMVILRHAPNFNNLLGYDEMTHIVVIKERGFWKPLSDVAVSALQMDMQEAGLRTIGYDTVHQAVAQRAAERAFHPVRDYLRGLTWDGQLRLDDWLITYCKAQVTDSNDKYVRLVGRAFLISMVARVMQPGCKVDSVLILGGKQGRRKSAVAKLLGSAWFSDSMPSISVGKDAQQHLRGKWLVELGELAAMSKSEAGHLKQFLTVTSDKYRPSYGRNEVEYPRQCVFLGTTNEDRYLIDATGGRRFWPITVTDVCDTDALVRDLDQLFAEAFVAHERRETWWLDTSVEQGQAAEEQEARHDTDVWEQRVAWWLRNQQETTPLDVLSVGLDMRTADANDTHSKRVQRILRRLGWVPERKSTRRYWVPGEAWTPPRDDPAGEPDGRGGARDGDDPPF